MTKSKKIKLPIRKYLILIFIAVLLITNSTFSKYVSTSTGSGETRVAIFASDVERTLYIEKIAPGETYTVPIVVSNFEGEGNSLRISEVSQQYTLEAFIEGEIPLTLSWVEAPGSPSIVDDFHVGDNPVGSGQTHRYNLTVNWPENNNEYTLQDELVVIRIRVHVEQID